MRRRLASLTAALGLTAAHPVTYATGSPALPEVPAAEAQPQPLLRVLPGHTVGLFAQPGRNRIARLGARTRFGSPRVLPVVARRGRWLGVLTEAGRRNGAVSWIRAGGRRLRPAGTHYRIEADRSRRVLRLLRRGRLVEQARIAVGSPGSPTPTGRFAVTDKLSSKAFGSYYGRGILALSGVQTRLPRGWPGGNRMAIHGTPTGRIAGQRSAGCVRAPDRALRTLLRRVPIGTVVTIRR